jgi:hypothetical protein
MTEGINQRRRRLFGAAAIGIAASQLGLVESGAAPSSKTALPKVSPMKSGTNSSFKSLKQIDAGLLSVGYAEDGPAHGSPVILLHGWPYDIYSFVDVTILGRLPLRYLRISGVRLGRQQKAGSRNTSI